MGNLTPVFPGVFVHKSTIIKHSQRAKYTFFFLLMNIPTGKKHSPYFYKLNKNTAFPAKAHLRPTFFSDSAIYVHGPNTRGEGVEKRNLSKHIGQMKKLNILKHTKLQTARFSEVPYIPVLLALSLCLWPLVE